MIVLENIIVAIFLFLVLSKFSKFYLCVFFVSTVIGVANVYDFQPFLHNFTWSDNTFFKIERCALKKKKIVNDAHRKGDFKNGGWLLIIVLELLQHFICI